MTTTLPGKNQITVPAEITQKLGLATGTRFVERFDVSGELNG